MRVLIPTDPFLPVPPAHYGGVERIVALLVAELRRRGHEVGLIAHPESTAATDYFTAWPQPDPRSPVAHWQNMRAVAAAAAAFRPDLVHSFARLLYLLPLLPRRVAKIMSYGRPTGGRQIGIAAALARRSLVFTGCSEFIAAMGRSAGGVWRAIPNFVDAAAYRFVPAVPDDAPLVFLGRVEAIKGAHIAIAVAKQTGRRLLIAGTHSEGGPEGEYWRAQIAPELGANGIDYLGPVDDAAKDRLLGAAAALIVPIQWDEPFGLVFAEALACGTPVISCPRGALPEIVRPGVDGFLVGDVAEACRAVDKLGSIDRRRCRERAEQCFSVAAVVPRYETLYESMLAGSRIAPRRFAATKAHRTAGRLEPPTRRPG